MMARLFFILVPTIIAGALFSFLLHPGMGLVVGFGVLMLSIDLTEPKHDRGENK